MGTSSPIARPIPVLPDVASMTVVFPGVISPRASACSIMYAAMRSFTLPPGFCISLPPDTSAHATVAMEANLANQAQLHIVRSFGIAC